MEPPDKPGAYLVREADETDWHPVIVARKNGQLVVYCPLVGGGYPIRHYHDNLNDLQWKLAGW